MKITNYQYKEPELEVFKPAYSELFYKRITVQAKVLSSQIVYDEADFWHKKPHHMLELCEIRDINDGILITDYRQLEMTRNVWRKFFVAGDYMEFTALVGVFKKCDYEYEGLDLADILTTVRNPHNIQLIKKITAVPISGTIEDEIGGAEIENFNNK